MCSKKFVYFVERSCVLVTDLKFSFVLDFADTQTVRMQSHGTSILLHAVIEIEQRYSAINLACLHSSLCSFSSDI